MKARSHPFENRFFLYAIWLFLSILLFWKPCLSLIRFSLSNDDASHVILIPFLGACLIFLERKAIFSKISPGRVPGAAVSAVALLIYGWAFRSAHSWSSVNLLSAYTIALVLLSIGGFIVCFGPEAAIAGRFALLFLFLTVPIPEPLLERVIYFLQKGSADIAEVIFDLVRVPALREGFVFHLARVNIEVAKECSGIRSSMALLILALLLAHLFLRTFWKQSLFVLAGVFIMIVKNGVRIATLTILAQYVDPGFLYGRLHREGGVVFFLLGLLLLWPLFWFLERTEKQTRPVARPAGS